ncbi:hypothetical protein DH09_15790 [Bacillaceae bacterium JMAK1]|nr:hypothetical protein DH09_15790 [Bacillaceae bacterium JMAK1]
MKIIPIQVKTERALKSFNFYLVQNNNDLVLIDAGYDTEECWNGLLQALQNHQLHLTDITAIVLTHHHPDHVGLVNRIRKQIDVPLYVHPESVKRLTREPKFMEMRINFYKRLYQQAGCGAFGEKQIDRLQRSKETNIGHRIEGELTLIDVAKPLFDFDLVETPGHAPDQIALQHDNMLISGDLLIQHISSNALIEPDTNGNRLFTMQQHIHSLQTVQQLDVQTVYPGHGSVITNHQTLIHERLQGIQQKAEHLRELMLQKPMSANELAITMYQKRYESQFPLVMSEIIGHLDYMESKSMTMKTEKDGIFEFEPVFDHVK